MSRRTSALLMALVVLASTLVAMPVSAGTEGGDDRWDPLGPGLDGKVYVVVAPGEWEATMTPLMEWRDRTSGYTSLFLSLEEAESRGVGDDRAARLRSSISDAEPDALLLVGDSDVIPVRRVFTDILQDGNQSDPLNFRWTDDYYAYGNETDWDRDGDGVYGEDGEVFAEVADAHRGHQGAMVGRIPASTELEAERFVAKLLAYERSPPAGDWFTSALILSGLMDVPNALDNPYTPDVDGGYELFSDNSYKSHSRLQEIIPDRYDRTWLYDYPKLEGGGWNRSIDILDRASAVAAFDQGHSMVAMNGHGYIDGSGLAHYNGSGYSNYWWDWHPAYDYTDADNASNGGRLPWVYVAACYVGDVTVPGDRTLERLVMNPDGGAVGIVAGNGENYKAESMANASYGNWFLERHFWTYYMQGGPGHAMLETKRDYLSLVASDEVPHTPLYDAYYVADYLSPNLLGDPLTEVWTDVPGTLSVSTFEDVNDPLDGIRLTVVDGEGVPLPGAKVYVGWDGNSTLVRTDALGAALVEVPLDAGDLEVVVSARDHIPASTVIERPLVAPDLEVSGMTWKAPSGDVGRPVLNGEEVTLMASITVHGRYDFDQARVRFSVAPENGDFERLVPDVFAAVWTGEHPVAETTWTPPWPGHWEVRAEVNPAGELPDATIMNNFGQATMAVQGPPSWVTLPPSVTMLCTEGPGSGYDLRVHLADSDTPVEDLVITARPIGQLPEGVTYDVDPEGRLRVCTSLASSTFRLRLDVTDGSYTDTTELEVVTGRPPPRLRLVGETFRTLAHGATATGNLTMENLGPGPVPEGLAIVDLSGNLLFDITPEGSYTFSASVPGTYQVRVGIQRPDGSSDPRWEGTVLSFTVVPDAGWPPQAYGWKDLDIAAGEKVTVHLQALDLEGGDVTYSLTVRGDLDAEIDPHTGMLTLRPGEEDVGRHELTVALSDGSSSEEYVLQVFVTETPSSGSALWIVMGMALVLLFAGAVYWMLWWRKGRD